MPQSIIAAILTALFTNFGLTQSQFEQQLLQEEMAYFYATNDSVRGRCVVEKIHLFIAENLVDDRLFAEVKRLDNEWVLEEEKNSLYWNISVVCYLMNEPYYYLKYAQRYRDCSTYAIEMDVLDFLACVKRDQAKANDILSKLVLQDSSLHQLSKLIDANVYESKFKVLARFGSVVLPGSGLFIAKEPIKGVTSFGLNTATFFAVRYLIQNSLYINSISWGMNLIQRFYLGGMALTEKMIGKKEAKEKAHLAAVAEDALKTVLLRYPLEFKD
jgi:hypothetical protein